MKKINATIYYLFLVYLFFLPLIVIPFTSELFEFNKIVFTYLFTILIILAWATKCIFRQKLIFRRTILDIPMLVFLFSQIISTVFSLDIQTSIFGYYSRFNGGLLSSLSYFLLYWAYVSNINSRKSKKLLKTMAISSVFVLTYAILEHFGIDKDIWVQDVQNRVFSTLGQPNWLAAYLICILPISFVYLIKKKQPIRKDIKIIFFFLFSTLLFLSLLYTKSRSGLIAFFLIDLIFWFITFLVLKKEIQKPFYILHLIFLLITLAVGTPWTAPIANYLSTKPQGEIKPQGPVLEVGGTESGEIRKIVWQGALTIWKNYPLIGSGVETFAFSYFKHRPASHNLTSEWDFLYNKAHNEYLNFLATTGILGLTTYLFLSITSLYILIKPIYPYFPYSLNVKNYKFKITKKQKVKTSNMNHENLFLTALFSAYLGILIVNFFGFSVVVTSFYLILFPAISFSLTDNNKPKEGAGTKNLNYRQIIFLAIALSIVSIILLCLGRYWYADFLYTKGKNDNRAKNYPQARSALLKANKLNPYQPYYFDEASKSALGLALEAYANKDNSSAELFAEIAISEVKKAVNLSPLNINFLKSQAATFIQLSALDENLINFAADSLEEASKNAPTDAKILYNLSLVYAKQKDKDKAISTLEKAIFLKANYKDARLAYAIFLSEKGEKTKAKEELNYILDYLDPNDSLVKQQLEEIK